jgi:hypothetical protein
VVISYGPTGWLPSSRFISVSAASAQRHGPVALHNHVEHPAFVVDRTLQVNTLAGDVQTTSSRCPRGDGTRRFRFSFLAICGPDLMVQQQVS